MNTMPAIEPFINNSRRLWTREEFERAGEIGLFRPEEKLELIEGEVFSKVAPQRSGHATSISLVESALADVFEPGHYIRVQLPLALSDRSEPEPDIAVVTGHIRDYAQAHPAAARLVVEVSDTTLRIDRGLKASLYAKAGIPEYWIINLNDKVIEVYREPATMADEPFGHHYRSITRYTKADTLSPLLTVDANIAVADLLP